MATLFLDHVAAAEVSAALERVRVLVRHASRYTTKCESKGGMDAHRALHEAEEEIEKALKRVAGR